MSDEIQVFVRCHQCDGEFPVSTSTLTGDVHAQITCPYCERNHTSKDFRFTEGASVSDSGREVDADVYERDDVSYSISVIEDEGALWGKWHCPVCDTGGSSSRRCNTRDEAILAAQTNVSPHHYMKHRRG